MKRRIVIDYIDRQTYVISGRVSGDDDDTVYVVDARNQGEAEASFKAQLIEDDPDADDDSTVYIISVETLNQAIENRVRADSSEHHPLPSIDHLYLISGRVSGDDDDTLHIVEAKGRSEAEALFRDRLIEDDPNCKDDDMVFIISSVPLSEAIDGRLQATAPSAPEANPENEGPSL